MANLVERKRGSVSTTDATPTSVTGATFTMPADSAAHVRMVMLVRNTDTDAARTIVTESTWKRSGTDAPVQGGATSTVHDQGDETFTPTVAVVVATNDIVPQVTGDAATNLSWTAWVEIHVLSA